VLHQNKKGYGHACLKGLEYLAQKTQKPDIVVFLDGDYSDYPQELNLLIEPILEQNFDFVLGARVAYLREKNAMTPQQIFGNWLATGLMKLFFNANRFGSL
jgi:glycosyltransferase involved in cell wall biosynthesis